MWHARTSIARTLGLAALSFGFVLVCAWLVTQDEVAPLLAGVVGLIFFGGCTIAILWRLRHVGPAIEISTAGLCWRQFSDRTIPWHEVVHAEVRVVRRQKFLCLWLRTPVQWRGRMMAKSAALSTQMGFGDMALSVLGTDRSFDELVVAVAHYVPVDREAVDGRR